MRGPKEIEAAFNDLAVASTKATVGSDVWVQLVAMAGTLGWVLGRKTHTENVDAILREIKSVVKGTVTG